MTIDEYGAKPRKGKTLLHFTPDTSDFQFELNTNNFIASVEHWARGVASYSVLDSSRAGFHVELTRLFETVDIGDRQYRINMEIIYDDGASGSLLLFSNLFDRKVCKELTISFRDDTNTLTVYLGGRAIEITSSTFVPDLFYATEDDEESIRDIRFFSLYVPSEVGDSIPLTWRKWYKDQVETGVGYPKFAEAFRAFRGNANSLFGSELHWDDLGLFVDRPESIDFESRELSLMTEWTPPLASDPAWDSISVIEPF